MRNISLLMLLFLVELTNAETLQDRQKNRVDLDVEVKEKQTGQFSIGGGFSSTNGAMANVGISEKNFLGVFVIHTLQIHHPIKDMMDLILQEELML